MTEPAKEAIEALVLRAAELGDLAETMGWKRLRPSARTLTGRSGRAWILQGRHEQWATLRIEAETTLLRVVLLRKTIEVGPGTSEFQVLSVEELRDPTPAQLAGLLARTEARIER